MQGAPIVGPRFLPLFPTYTSLYSASHRNRLGRKDFRASQLISAPCLPSHPANRRSSDPKHSIRSAPILSIDSERSTRLLLRPISHLSSFLAESHPGKRPHTRPLPKLCPSRLHSPEFGLDVTDVPQSLPSTAVSPRLRPAFLRACCSLRDASLRQAMERYTRIDEACPPAMPVHLSLALFPSISSPFPRCCRMACFAMRGRAIHSQGAANKGTGMKTYPKHRTLPLLLRAAFRGEGRRGPRVPAAVL